MGEASITLKVREASAADVYKDIARINADDRAGIPESTICKITVVGRSRHLVLRGLAGVASKEIALDEYSRNQLKVQPGMAYEFKLKRASMVGQVLWALHAAEPGVRVATWFGIIGTVMGAVGLIVSFF